MVLVLLAVLVRRVSGLGPRLSEGEPRVGSRVSGSGLLITGVYLNVDTVR